MIFDQLIAKIRGATRWFEITKDIIADALQGAYDRGSQGVESAESATNIANNAVDEINRISGKITLHLEDNSSTQAERIINIRDYHLDEPSINGVTFQILASVSQLTKSSSVKLRVETYSGDSLHTMLFRLPTGGYTTEANPDWIRTGQVYTVTIWGAYAQVDAFNQTVVEEAPATGKQYARKNKTWAEVVYPTQEHGPLTGRDSADQHPIKAITGLEEALNGKLTEAPSDGKQYARTSKDWVALREASIDVYGIVKLSDKIIDNYRLVNTASAIFEMNKAITTENNFLRVFAKTHSETNFQLPDRQVVIPEITDYAQISGNYGLRITSLYKVSAAGQKQTLRIGNLSARNLLFWSNGAWTLDTPANALYVDQTYLAVLMPNGHFRCHRFS